MCKCGAARYVLVVRGWFGGGMCTLERRNELKDLNPELIGVLGSHLKAAQMRENEVSR